jgi:hypothetical protein
VAGYDDNPLGNLVRGLRQATDDYLASVLETAVDAGIITSSQRNQIIDLAKTDPSIR